MQLPRRPDLRWSYLHGKDYLLRVPARTFAPLLGKFLVRNLGFRGIRDM